MRARIAIALFSFIPGILCAHHSRSDYDTSEFVISTMFCAAAWWAKSRTAMGARRILRLFIDQYSLERW